jgi:hypothetical protein
LAAAIPDKQLFFKIFPSLALWAVRLQNPKIASKRAAGAVGWKIWPTKTQTQKEEKKW